MATLTTRTLLVVEDTAACATMLEIALMQIRGLTITVVASLDEAISILEGDSPVCALVTDIHLRQASGLELVRWVRSREARQRLPIVVISGDSDPDTPAMSLTVGADAYFAKPFSPTDVRHKLEDLINAQTRTSLLP